MLPCRGSLGELVRWLPPRQARQGSTRRPTATSTHRAVRQRQLGRLRRRGFRPERAAHAPLLHCVWLCVLWLIFCFLEFLWFAMALMLWGFVLFSFGFSPSHEAAHVLPKCPSYKEETYAKTGEPNVTRPLLRQGADTPLGNRTERVGPRAE
jgi:fatty acid desaturase